MDNPFALSRRNARRMLQKNLGKHADQVNTALASGVRLLNFPPGAADVAVRMLNQAGGWFASVRGRSDEQATVVVRDSDASRADNDCPFISRSTAKARSLEYVGRASTEINEQLGNGVRVFLQPIGIVDDLVRLLNEPGTGWKAEIKKRDEEDQMQARFLVTESDEELPEEGETSA